jgi:cytochrome b561
MLKSTADRYGAIPITIHRLSAILVFVAIGSGFQAGNAIDPAAKAAPRWR